jgi:hypothetical protein
VVIRVVRQYELLEDLQSYLTALKDRLKQAAKVERELESTLEASQRSARSWLVRHRQNMRELVNASTDLEVIADLFLLNKLGLEEADILSSMSGVLGRLAEEEGEAATTLLTSISGGGAGSEQEATRARELARKLAEGIEAQVARLSRFENFGELIRELKRLISRQEELRERLRKLLEERFGE